MTTVLKLGGSVVTDKEVPETVDEEALGRAADAIAGALAGGSVDPGELVVVHGGGSFGHHHADRHGVTDTTGSHDAAALAAIHAAMGELNAAVVGALHERGVEALPVRPLSLAHRGAVEARSNDDTRSLRLPTGSVPAMLEEGFLPVLHGDVVVHEGRGGTILSGDDIVAALARSLAADRVGLCSTVPGVLDADGEVIRCVDALSDVAALGDSDATDVTGGMAGKVRTLLALPVPAHVFGLADLPVFLSGEAVGTVVGGDS